MAGEIVPPSLGATSFNCPHCGAVAHQTWYKLFMDMYEKDQYPWVPTAEVLQRLDQLPREGRESLRKFFQKRLSKMPFIEVREDGHVYLRNELENTSVSRCYSCDKLALWVADQLVYPHQKYFVAPAAEMPENVRTDFLEAASIVDTSARGAAALLRLCIQKIVVELGEKGDNLNYDIGQLVEKRAITAGIQKALDVVRVVGNNAVHPGVIDFNDNKAVAVQLFGLVNVIVESTLAAPKHIQTIYETIVPENVRAAIEKRDEAKQLPPPKSPNTP